MVDRSRFDSNMLPLFFVTMKKKPWEGPLRKYGDHPERSRLFRKALRHFEMIIEASPEKVPPELQSIIRKVRGQLDRGLRIKKEEAMEIVQQYRMLQSRAPELITAYVIIAVIMALVAYDQCGKGPDLTPAPEKMAEPLEPSKKSE